RGVAGGERITGTLRAIAPDHLFYGDRPGSTNELRLQQLAPEARQAGMTSRVADGHDGRGGANLAGHAADRRPWLEHGAQVRLIAEALRHRGIRAVSGHGAGRTRTQDRDRSLVLQSRDAAQ